MSSSRECDRTYVMKDLFYYVKRAKLNADDHQIHVSNVDLVNQICFAGCRLKNQLLSLSSQLAYLSTPVSLNKLRLLGVSLYVGVYSTSLRTNSSFQPAT